MRTIKIVANGLDLNATADILERVQGDDIEVQFVILGSEQPEEKYSKVKRIGIVGHGHSHSITRHLPILIIDDYHPGSMFAQRLLEFDVPEVRQHLSLEEMLPSAICKELLPESKKGRRAEHIDNKQQQRYRAKSHYHKGKR